MMRQTSEVIWTRVALRIEGHVGFLSGARKG